MASILGLGLDAAAGGVFGLLGTGLGRVMQFFEKKEDRKQERAKWEHELKLHELNQRARLQESEIELAITAEKGSWEGLTSSQTAASSIGKGSKWVVNTMHMVRPTLTLALWLLVGMIFIVTKDESIVGQVLFAASAATLWWFGDRAPQYKTNAPKGA